MRIGVFGICQASAVGEALFHLLDGPEMLIYRVAEAQNSGDPDHVESLFAACDVVFSYFLPERFGQFSTEKFEKKCKKFVLIPPFTFSGFHPDCIIFQHEDVIYESPLNNYNSAIVAASYSLGLSAERTFRLFNKFVFQKLGYFDDFAKSRAFMDHLAREFDLDLTAEWRDWMTSGVFMHSINHPKPQVLASIAKLAAVKAGLIPAGTPTPDLSGDALSRFPIWPVYPEIADALGMKGSYMFRKGECDGPEMWENHLISLREFIQRSYENYAKVPAEAFEIEPIADVRKILETLVSGTA